MPFATSNGLISLHFTKGTYKSFAAAKSKISALDLVLPADSLVDASEPMFKVLFVVLSRLVDSVIRVGRVVNLPLNFARGPREGKENVGDVLPFGVGSANWNKGYHG